MSINLVWRAMYVKWRDIVSEVNKEHIGFFGVTGLG